MQYSDYRIDLYDAAGTKTAELSDYEYLTFTRQRNAVGGGEFTVRANSPAVQDLQDDGLVEIYRQNPSLGLAWYREMTGFYCGQRRAYSGYDHLTVSFSSENDLLNRRIVAWYNAVSNRTSFVSQPAETIAKMLVYYNAGAGATVANGRLRTPAAQGITNEADGGRGNVLSYTCAWNNLLLALQNVSGKKGDGDFEILRSGITGRNFVFYWRPHQLGTDRTATLLFSLERNNMLLPVYTRNWRARRSVAIVGGQGEETSRATAIRLASSTTLDTEVFVDARDCATVSALNAKGDKALANLIQTETISFGVSQNPGCYYGIDYFLGDRVGWTYAGQDGEILIDRVTGESYKEGPEKITLGLKNENG